MAITIKTNNHVRPILSFYDLTGKEIKEFDSREEGKLKSESYIRYKGNIYSLGEFSSCHIEGYDCYCYHTAFSGVLLKFVDGDYVKMASYYS